MATGPSPNLVAKSTELKQILDELAEIRNAQGNIKQARGKVFDQLKALQEGVQKKVRHTMLRRSTPHV